MQKLFFGLILLASIYANAQTVIPLYKGAAPGSENWIWSEREIKLGNNRILMDVSRPTLTAFFPSKPNGIAVIIAPGGGFHILSFDSEGTEVAKWLIEKGITAFVLKYRLVHEDSTHPENSLWTLLRNRNFKRLDSINAPVVPMALEDGLTAIKYVRQHASEYHINSNEIGFMGFSAGGVVTMSVAYNATNESRPDFVAPIYAYEKAILGSAVPTAKTPIFICAASDDDLGLASHSVNIYLKWLKAN